jgi:hypothetical protein
MRNEVVHPVDASKERAFAAAARPDYRRDAGWIYVHTYILYAYPQAIVEAEAKGSYHGIGAISHFCCGEAIVFGDEAMHGSTTTGWRDDLTSVFTILHRELLHLLSAFL